MMTLSHITSSPTKTFADLCERSVHSTRRDAPHISQSLPMFTLVNSRHPVTVTLSPMVVQRGRERLISSLIIFRMSDVKSLSPSYCIMTAASWALSPEYIMMFPLPASFMTLSTVPSPNVADSVVWMIPTFSMRQFSPICTSPSKCTFLIFAASNDSATLSRLQSVE